MLGDYLLMISRMQCLRCVKSCGKLLCSEVWKGSGIGQAQLSRFMYQWTGVRIMTSDWSKYRDIVVCALALYY